MKKSYQAPRLTVHGTVAELTQSASRGKKFDGNFQLGVNAPLGPDGSALVLS